MSQSIDTASGEISLGTVDRDSIRGDITVSLSLEIASG